MRLESIIFRLASIIGNIKVESAVIPTPIQVRNEFS